MVDFLYTLAGYCFEYSLVRLGHFIWGLALSLDPKKNKRH